MLYVKIKTHNINENDRTKDIDDEAFPRTLHSNAVNTLETMMSWLEKQAVLYQ